jgi:hypothetical protein
MLNEIKIRKIHSANSMNKKCRNCKFWFEHYNTNLIDDFYRSQSIWDLIKEKFFERNTKLNCFDDFLKNDGIIIGAFKNKKNIGLSIAGKYYLFPKLKKFESYKPEQENIFLSCIYTDSGYRENGLNKRLLLAMADRVQKKGYNSIETIGKRLTDDLYEKEYYNSPLIPFKFLIQNGFYIKTNDELFPVLRLDLKNLVKDFEPQDIYLSDLLVKKKLKNQVYIKK